MGPNHTTTQLGIAAPVPGSDGQRLPPPLPLRARMLKTGQQRPTKQDIEYHGNRTTAKAGRGPQLRTSGKPMRILMVVGVMDRRSGSRRLAYRKVILLFLRFKAVL